MMIDLEQGELEILVDALGEKPFKEVSSLITKLQKVHSVPEHTTVYPSGLNNSSANMLLG